MVEHVLIKAYLVRGSNGGKETEPTARGTMMCIMGSPFFSMGLRSSPIPHVRDKTVPPIQHLKQQEKTPPTDTQHTPRSITRSMQSNPRTPPNVPCDRAHA